MLADGAEPGATAGVLGVGVIRRPTSFPASQDGSLKDSGAVLVVTVAAAAAGSGRRPWRRVRGVPPPRGQPGRPVGDAIRVNLLAAAAKVFGDSA